jgi:hypothetical protein
MKRSYWRDFGKRLLRNTFGSMLEEIMRGWIKLRDEKLHLYSSSDIIKIRRLRRVSG